MTARRMAWNAPAVAVTIAVIAAVVVACSYSPQFESGVTNCATSGPPCPSGFSCDRTRDVCVATDGGSPRAEHRVTPACRGEAVGAA